MWLKAGTAWSHLRSLTDWSSPTPTFNTHRGIYWLRIPTVAEQHIRSTKSWYASAERHHLRTVGYTPLVIRKAPTARVRSTLVRYRFKHKSRPRCNSWCSEANRPWRCPSFIWYHHLQTSRHQRWWCRKTVRSIQSIITSTSLEQPRKTSNYGRSSCWNNR